MQLMLIDIYQYFKEESWVLFGNIGQNDRRKEFTDRENFSTKKFPTSVLPFSKEEPGRLLWNYMRPVRKFSW